MTRRHATIAAVAAAALIAVAAVMLWPHSNPVTADATGRAVTACHKAVEARLITPTAAVYSGEHPEVTSESFRVVGQVDVDSKGTGRQTYICTGDRPDSGFTVTHLDLVPR